MADFILPDIGEGIVECELVKWLIKEGDVIVEDQPVAEVMTDKALVEIPAPHAGRVTKLYYQEGEIARVHSPLFAVTDTETAETPSAPAAEPKSPAEDEPTAPAPSAAPQTSSGARDFVLPDIGEGIVECEVVTWQVQDGDEIEEDQPIVDVMTDKAMVEITAPEAGKIVKHYYAQGDIAKVHSPLFAYIPRDGAASTAPVSVSASEPAKETETRPAQVTAPKAARDRIPASPAVRRLVREMEINLDDILGSGPNGRVLKEDVLRFRKGPETVKTPITPAAVEAQGEVRVEPIRGIRAVMAKRMVESANTIPHFIYGDEVDVTALLALREQLKPLAEKEGVRLTLMPFIMKALAMAVAEFPILNSRVNDEVTEIHYLPNCNIGMAVDTPKGLIVPNVKGVESLSILGIAREVTRLTQAAREGGVRQEDLRDGTISISNIGALGGTYASPIISKPEVAIVALGRTQTLPRFADDGSVVARSIMNISWAGDHRIIDGGTIARFSNRWRQYLEDPASMVLHLR
ncbi:dihydrolipoyllysine-residue acetyltransferase [Mangrovitalea sediminis]|uniref:dihydrolipoyllysine-residue acetyltransferase n=1 Tax=Mangrovitalea sediminis TaxID=1982043 RepID=UPI000BE5BC34|nr:dihydrolipoyllysine-residue acetyltransferase [Mangrovitalea sediminis]